MLKGVAMATGNDQSGPGTTVGVNVALSGTLKDQNDIVVFGMVDGEVISDKTITVGKTAQIKGPLKGRVISVAGLIRGSIEASEKLELLETGKVYGSLTTKDLVIHSGAIFIGKCNMGDGEGEEEIEEVGEQASKETLVSKTEKKEASPIEPKSVAEPPTPPAEKEEIPVPDED